MKCRHCNANLTFPVVDLGTAPHSNGYIAANKRNEPERWYPLRILVCESCWLVQTEDFSRPEEMFDSNYAYFSSFSTTWLEHAKQYAWDVIKRYNLTQDSQVVEVASNDGYLLQYFKNFGIPCLGIEPTASTAAAARSKGIAVIEEFFGAQFARQLHAKGCSADLLVANNVLAHVPDINDFVSGFAILLKPQGVATLEFPHVLKMIQGLQFDTIYHEHFSYLSLTAAIRIFSANGLDIFDVEEISTHGGSLRIHAQRLDFLTHPHSGRLTQLLQREHDQGIANVEFYRGFQGRVDGLKNRFLDFLLQKRRENELVAGYGAAAKGNTLLNYAGVRPDLLPFVVDRNPAKQGKLMPGSRCSIVPEGVLVERKPKYIVIFPWNIKDEVKKQLEYIHAWGGSFVTAVPTLLIES